MSSDQNTSSSNEPSMVGAHAKYVQGAVSSLIGNESGEQTKEEAVKEMRDAQAATDPFGSRPEQNTLLGKAENLVGKAVGCEGMEKEGAARVPRGPQEASGTG